MVVGISIFLEREISKNIEEYSERIEEQIFSYNRKSRFNANLGTIDEMDVYVLYLIQKMSFYLTWKMGKNPKGSSINDVK